MSKAKEAEAPTKILKYLKDQNRPYSAGDILNNLHKEFNKACVQRALDSLTAEGKVKEKVYGKQKVYMVDQSLFPVVSEAELKKMDKDMVEQQEKLTTAQKLSQQLESRLSSLQSSLTLQDAQSQLQALNEECTALNERLQNIKEGAGAVTPEESAAIHKCHSESVRQWRKRKRMAMDIVGTILEGYPKSKKEFFEEAGLETDEEHGVKIPST